MRYIKGERGYVAVVAMLMTTLVATMGVSMLQVQNAALQDTYGIAKAGEAKFMAESGLQEAQYVVTHLNSAFTGTSQEQTVVVGGQTMGSYEYTVTKSGNTYSVSANGYFPDKARSGKSGGAKSSAANTFTYNPIPVTTTSNGLIVLNLTADGALSQSGAGTANAGGKLWDNSRSASALKMSGNSALIATEFNLVGGFSLSANASMTGPIKVSKFPFNDPFIYIPEPDPSTLSVRSTTALKITGNNSAVLNPGVYAGGISLAGNGSVTLNPGIYYIKADAAGNGVGFAMTGNVSLTAHGVTIFLEGATAEQSLFMTGNGATDWTPMTSGTYKGISYFQRRSSTAGATFTGNSHTMVAGTLYLAGANFTVTGNGYNIASLIVCDTLSISGSASMNNYASMK